MFVNVPIIKLAVAKSNFLIVPEPDGPVMETNSPWWIFRLTSSKAVKQLVPVA